MHTCKFCSIKFEKTLSKRGYTSYCSDSCQVKFWNRNNPEKYKANRKRLWCRKWGKDKGACCICGFNRATDYAHILSRKDGGKLSKDNITILCPNHHRLFDSNQLTKEELELIKPVNNL